MSASIIDRVEIREFAFEAQNLGVQATKSDQRGGGGGTPGGAVEYMPGATATMTRYAVVIEGGRLAP